MNVGKKNVKNYEKILYSKLLSERTESFQIT